MYGVHSETDNVSSNSSVSDLLYTSLPSNGRGRKSSDRRGTPEVRQARPLTVASSRHSPLFFFSKEQDETFLGYVRTRGSDWPVVSALPSLWVIRHLTKTILVPLLRTCMSGLLTYPPSLLLPIPSSTRNTPLCATSPPLSVADSGYILDPPPPRIFPHNVIVRIVIQHLSHSLLA